MHNISSILKLTVVYCPITASPGRTPKKKEVERKQSLDIERWLKSKFREGCANMREVFLSKDAKNSGLVRIMSFRGYLWTQFDLQINQILYVQCNLDPLNFESDICSWILVHYIGSFKDKVRWIFNKTFNNFQLISSPDKMFADWIAILGLYQNETPSSVVPLQVSFDEFIEVLAQHGLRLEKKLLAAFLSRCSVTPRREGVPYLEFLHRFQDRSEDGMTHNILTNSKHRLVRL